MNRRSFFGLMLGLPALPKIITEVFKPKSKWVNMTRRAWIGGKKALQLAFGNNPVFTNQLGQYNGVEIYEDNNIGKRYTV